ncbi:MAG: 7-cyano-7-deazaguanine synthase QueC [Acidobacteria bacterium]|nr:7-cyano-7-deazaguanine synthase QueC [Acidobacteriota bacterium]
MKKSVVLLSGGLDSATVLAIALKEGFRPVAMSFDYGQRHRVELRKSRLLAEKYKVPHVVMHVPLNTIGGSALTDSEIDVPDTPAEEIGGKVPVTYVPARNTIFLAIAAGYCEVNGIEDIFIGTNAMDYSGYPDCRPEFIKAMEIAITLGTRYTDEGRQFSIHAPLSNMKKSEIIRKGTELGVDYSLTSTCYNPDQNGNPCGRCDSCKLRLRGFREAGLTDPLPYPDEIQAKERL